MLTVNPVVFVECLRATRCSLSLNERWFEIFKILIARVISVIYESDEDEYVLREALSLQGKLGVEARKAAGITEQIIRQITNDGRVIERKVVTYPGEETEEVEEWETTEIGDERTDTYRKTGDDNNKKKALPAKPVQAKLQAPASNTEVIIVPGHTKIEYDPITNAKIVTEKTTTGYQQIITTTTPEGLPKIQVKTFFDPVETQDEAEEEEETWEETETIEPGVKTTTTTTTTAANKAQ